MMDWVTIISFLLAYTIAWWIMRRRDRKKNVVNIPSVWVPSDMSKVEGKLTVGSGSRHPDKVK